MRAVLAIVVGLACPLTAAAQSAGDRYGPAPATRLSQVAADAYQGRMLSWANKQATIPTAGATVPYSPASGRQQAAYAPFQPQVPLPLQQRPAQPQPAASIYAPPAQPARTPPQAQTQQPALSRPQVAAQTQSRPQALVQAQPQPQIQPQQAPPQRVAAMVRPGTGGPPRLYSVHRSYGMTPDAIPEPPAGNRYVLIGPPDAPASAKTDDDDAPDARPGAF